MLADVANCKFPPAHSWPQPQSEDCLLSHRQHDTVSNRTTAAGAGHLHSSQNLIAPRGWLRKIRPNAEDFQILPAPFSNVWRIMPYNKSLWRYGSLRVLRYLFGIVWGHWKDSHSWGLNDAVMSPCKKLVTLPKGLFTSHWIVYNNDITMQILAINHNQGRLKTIMLNRAYLHSRNRKQSPCMPPDSNLYHSSDIVFVKFRLRLSLNPN